MNKALSLGTAEKLFNFFTGNLTATTGHYVIFGGFTDLDAAVLNRMLAGITHCTLTGAAGTVGNGVNVALIQIGLELLIGLEGFTHLDGLIYGKGADRSVADAKAGIGLHSRIRISTGTVEEKLTYSFDINTLGGQRSLANAGNPAVNLVDLLSVSFNYHENASNSSLIKVVPDALRVNAFSFGDLLTGLKLLAAHYGDFRSAFVYQLCKYLGPIKKLAISMPFRFKSTHR